MPRTRPEDLYPEEIEQNMSPRDTTAQFLAFLEEARSLQREFKDQIHLLVGMETELIHAHTVAEATALVSEHPLDYLVGSVHHVNQIPIDFDLAMYARAEVVAFEKAAASGGESGTSATECLFRDYFDAQWELLVQLKPMVVGHFDLVGMFRPDHALSEECWGKVRRNVDVIVGYGGIVELNSRAWKKGLEYAYPRKEIVQYMMGKGIRFCLSDDSHGPNDVGMHYAKLVEYIRNLGITTVFYPAPPSVPGTLSNQVVSIENIADLPFWKQFV
ncbi:histidinolphosphatase [Podochytrium sp. JEL0797]|nr:histidinolphosphatase [Podochytrium sp. JEL0797]